MKNNNNLTGFYSKVNTFRKNKLTLGGFLTYWILPTLGIVIPFLLYFASKGYLSFAK